MRVLVSRKTEHFRAEPAVTVAMSAGVADLGNTVIGRRPRRSSLSIVPIALLDVCTAARLRISDDLEAGLLVDRSTEDIAAGTSGAIARPVFFHPSGT